MIAIGEAVVVVVVVFSRRGDGMAMDRGRMEAGDAISARSETRLSGPAARQPRGNLLGPGSGPAARGESQMTPAWRRGP